MLFITYETEGVCRTLRYYTRYTPHACCTLKRDRSYERIWVKPKIGGNFT